MDRFSNVSDWLLGTYFDGDEGGGVGAGEGAGGEGQDSKPEPKTFDEAYVKTLRSEAAANRKKAQEAEAKLQAAEDERKPELQRLQERAEKLTATETERDTLKAEAESLRTALSEVVEEHKKRLKALDADMLDLLPEAAPTAQLAWLTRACAKAEKDAADKKTRGVLPPGGGRNPGAQSGEKTPTQEERNQAAAHYASRF